MKKNSLQNPVKSCRIVRKCSGLWLKIQARCGQKDPRKPSRRSRAVIMAYLRSKSSENRVKAGVGAKTRSAEQFFFIFMRKTAGWAVFVFFCDTFKIM